MGKNMRTSLAFLLLFTLQAVAFAEIGSVPQDQVTRNIIAEGSCAIVGMSAEQAQLIALQRARAVAIEQVGGVEVSTSTLVKDYKSIAYYIKAYTKGLIVREKVEYPPAVQYQKDSTTAPIFEYRVKIVADVYIPQRKIKLIGLQADNNKGVYRNGEKMWVEVKTGRRAKIAIFNIMADDKVVMLFPNEYDRSNISIEKTPLVFPGKNSPIELIVQNLPGHERDVEALLVVALDTEFAKDFEDLFARNKALPFTDFFRKYAEIADYAENAIIAYEIIGGK